MPYAENNALYSWPRVNTIGTRQCSIMYSVKNDLKVQQMQWRHFSQTLGGGLTFLRVRYCNA